MKETLWRLQKHQNLFVLPSWNSLSVTNHSWRSVWILTVGPVLPDHSAVVREGLSSPLIPNGWTLGGVVSNHCPVYTELFADTDVDSVDIARGVDNIVFTVGAGSWVPCGCFLVFQLGPDPRTTGNPPNNVLTHKGSWRWCHVHREYVFLDVGDENQERAGEERKALWRLGSKHGLSKYHAQVLLRRLGFWACALEEPWTSAMKKLEFWTCALEVRCVISLPRFSKDKGDLMVLLNFIQTRWSICQTCHKS